MHTTLSGKVSHGTDVYTALVVQSSIGMIFCLVDKTNTIVSAYKNGVDGVKMAYSDKASEFAIILKKSLSYCSKKNGVPSVTKYGAATTHEVTVHGSNVVDTIVLDTNKRILEASVTRPQTKDGAGYKIYLCRDTNSIIPDNIEYISVTTANKTAPSGANDSGFVREDGTYVPMRSVEEIALYKDTEWLKYKNYYVVNDEAQAEQLFTFLDNYNGPIAYDTETTGLRINCFGKVNSKYERQLAEYNAAHPESPIREDKLVGIIFCVEENTSYYFPCANKRFKNLYEDVNNPYRQRIITNAKAYWTLATEANIESDMRDYVLNTAPEDFRIDVILMERVRQILTKKHIVTHHGTFDWKVDWQYEIDTNISDDTMIIHQLIYKFRDMGKGSESSKLKVLAWKEFAIDQWELDDFFPTFKEDDSNKTKSSGKGKKKNSNIDFSYMDIRGARIYAPADGDVTFMLFKKYIADLYKNHSEMEYIYRVEVLVSCAIGYMEFYGIRIDESKIEAARKRSAINCIKYESLIRQNVSYSEERELELFKALEEAEKRSNGEITDEVDRLSMELSDAMESSSNPLNISSPPQMSHLFYDVLGAPSDNGSKSVAKDKIANIVNYKNEDGSPMYPAVYYYQQYGKENALLVKFFAPLPEYMYPGGYVFPSFNQLSTNTGRMSCKNPNAQQFPKAITKIVIPRDGYVIVDADYSQIEARVITAIAGNVELAELFRNPDNDYHTLMASLMYEVEYSAVTKEMRSAAKAFNFGIPFGMGNGSLAVRLHGKKTKEFIADAAEKREMYFKNQPNTRKMFANVQEMASVNGYTATQFNRKRYYSFSNADGTVNEARRAAALRQAGNAIIQGTAADIFKISVARQFSYIRQNRLMGLMLIIDMIHDEQLLEVNLEKLNIQRVLADIALNMQFELEGYPPLFTGAGVACSWAKAKGAMNEIHPHLMDKFIAETREFSIVRDEQYPVLTAQDAENYFYSRIYEFRRDKILGYINNSENWGKELHPVIGGIINMQFNYGRGESAKGYTGPNGEKYTDKEFLLLNLKDFMTEFSSMLVVTDGVLPTWELFGVSDTTGEVDDENEDEYTDDEEYGANGDYEDVISDYEDRVGQFKLIEENESYGISMQEIIAAFKVCVIKNKKICGIDVTKLSRSANSELCNYLADHTCEGDDSNAVEVVFLKTGNVLNNTGIYVKGVSNNEIAKIIKVG